MWSFIDTTTGNAFNGEPPYIFWFDDGQSVNLNYVKKICIYTDEEYLTISCNSPVFSILKMDQLIPQQQRITMDAKRFVDLALLKVGESDNYTWQSTGYEYKDYYVHMLYFLANSSDAGEFIDTFTIGAEHI